MALTQMQIIQSLGEAMSWFERELSWGVPPTELRHLSGRIGELYAALITNGQMATEVNQHGYDVVSDLGERVSVKTTAMMGGSGQISFNPNTLEQVDRIVILRINTDEMQVEILLNDIVDSAKDLMSLPAKSGKVSISLSKLIRPAKDRSEIPTLRTVRYKQYVIAELESGTIEVLDNEELVSPAKPVLKALASELHLSPLNGSGNPYNTRQLGSLVIRALDGLESA